MKILSVLDIPDPVLDRFRQYFVLIQGRLEDAAAVRPDGLLCSIQPYNFNRLVIDSLPDTVKAITTYSVGHDHIDLKAAADRGIAVFNTPGVLADAVADAAVLLVLGTARRVTESSALLRSGRWGGWRPDQLIGQGLSGKTLGILGMGSIGRAIAHRARAFGMVVTYHNRREIAGEPARYYKDARELVADSDVLVLAWPSTPETRYFISTEVLAAAKSTMILINIGRGDLVKDNDLVEALTRRTIFGAGLDVFENEPDVHPAYLELPNVFCLPHIGSSTWEARMAMADILIEAMTIHWAGGRPRNRIA